MDIYDYLEPDGLHSEEYLMGEDQYFATQRKFPYFLPRMFKFKAYAKKISKSPRLQSKLNLCPKCKNFTLSFTESGLFD